MNKKVFVSADWKEPFDSHSWDKEVVDRIRKWNGDNRYGVEFTCTDDVHNSVTESGDCRRCDIKVECGQYIQSSDVIIFVVGDHTAGKKAGVCDSISCSPAYSNQQKKYCKYLYNRGFANLFSGGGEMSYLQYEITTAVSARKPIVLVYNSVYQQKNWIPGWYINLLRHNYVNELCRVPFWKDGAHTQDCYQDIKSYLQ